MIVFIVAGSVLIFSLAYRYYSRVLKKWLDLKDSNRTPAVELNDGIDYVPAKPTLLLGQHFSAIAAAGPIVGPILAGIWFGWVPALLWILLGAIFIGGVHDFSSLVASIRHKAVSIGELVRQHMSPTSHILFLSFVWLALIYVIVAFTDITANTFKAVAQDTAFGPGVAMTSIIYLLLSVLMGIFLYKFKFKLYITTLIFLPLVLIAIWFGSQLPVRLISFMMSIPIKGWDTILLIYCFIASLIPMWLLLQPRGYLGGWLLFLTILVSLTGALFGGFEVNYPAINVEGFRSLVNGKFLFPLLFITIACGACSGFHAIVSSGTTSKQLSRETDAYPVGYGAMLLEGLVAVLALATLMILPRESQLLKTDPNLIYANGIANYLSIIGVDFRFALAFALLAFSTFVYDTLDVCARLARYIMQELFGWKTKTGAFIATFLTLSVPFLILMNTKEKGYMVAWPIFGTSNQLLASLTLLAISVWLIKTGKNAIYTILPMIFMMVMTLWSLVLLILPFFKFIYTPSTAEPDTIISGVFGIILLILSLLLIFEALNVLVLKHRLKEKA